MASALVSSSRPASSSLDGEPTHTAKALLNAFSARLHEATRQRRVAQMERAIAQTPNDPTLLRALASYHESEGRPEDAAGCYRRLVPIYRQANAVDKLILCYRKLERLGCSDPARLARELAVLYAELRCYDEAAEQCVRVVDIYLHTGHATAAAGYVRMLPDLGPGTARVRARLESLVKRPADPTAGM